MKLDLQVGVIALAAITSTGAHAELIDLENGAIYDSVRDVTWTKDVRYQETVLEPNPGPALLQGSVVMNADGTSHVVTALDIYQAGGGKRWDWETFLAGGHLVGSYRLGQVAEFRRRILVASTDGI